MHSGLRIVYKCWTVYVNMTSCFPIFFPSGKNKTMVILNSCPISLSFFGEKNSFLNKRCEIKGHTANGLFWRSCHQKYIPITWGTLVLKCFYSVIYFQTIVGIILGQTGSKSKQNQISKLLFLLYLIRK